MANRSTLVVYKNLLRALSSEGSSAYSYRLSPIYAKINDEFRRHRPLASKYCKHTDEALFVARTYLTYLESVRQRTKIHSTYSKGERSVRDAAHIVGLELPQTTDRAPLPLNQTAD